MGEEGRLHRRGVQEGHSARGPHHATQEGDEEATRDGGHGRHEEVQGVQHGPPGARGRSTLGHPRQEGEGRRGRRRLQARQEVNRVILSLKRLSGGLIKKEIMSKKKNFPTKKKKKKKKKK